MVVRQWIEITNKCTCILEQMILWNIVVTTSSALFTYFFSIFLVDWSVFENLLLNNFWKREKNNRCQVGVFLCSTNPWYRILIFMFQLILLYIYIDKPKSKYFKPLISSQWQLIKSTHGKNTNNWILNIEKNKCLN